MMLTQIAMEDDRTVKSKKRVCPDSSTPESNDQVLAKGKGKEVSFEGKVEGEMDADLNELVNMFRKVVFDETIDDDDEDEDLNDVVDKMKQGSMAISNSGTQSASNDMVQSTMEKADNEYVLEDGDAENTPMAGLDNYEDVLKRYENFKRFDTVADHSDHLFSAHISPMQQPSNDWTRKIMEEWRILENDLPETIFVRVYESRMDLLRAAIIGAKGTPYHDGLFFFDVCFPSTYPISPPLVRYHSHGLNINPNIYKCGEVRFSLPKASVNQEEKEMWVPGTSTMLQLLVSIQAQILNTHPLFNKHKYALLTSYGGGERDSLLYNEDTVLKSLKTMVYTMNKPPRNFEDFVVGHFRNRVHDILMACKAYKEGMQVGRLENAVQPKGSKNTCSINFKNKLASSIKPLIDAFDKIGAKEAQEFLPLSEKSKLSTSEHHHPPGTVIAPRAGQVVKVLIKDGMNIEKGQPLYVLEAMKKEDGAMTFSSSATPTVSKNMVHSVKKEASLNTQVTSHVSPLPTVVKMHKLNMKRMVEGIRNSRVGIFSMEDVAADPNYVEYSPIARLNNEDILKRFQSYKKFDTVADHSDHLFSANTSPMKQPPKEWAERIQKDWRELGEHLPETIFVRVYESRMDLLRALIIGPEGTPYHHGLFFFDVCIPHTYPYTPPLVRYHSGGLGINPNLYKCGKVRLSLPKTTGCQEESLWVPGISTILQLLVSIQGSILNQKPLFNIHTYANMRRDSVYAGQCSLLYNENTFIKSLKTMVITMCKPPKNFEDFVVGHFRNCVHDILMACKSYKEGVQVGCLVNGVQEEGNKEGCSITFWNDIASCINPLVTAFYKIGAKEAQEFLHLSEKKSPLPLSSSTLDMVHLNKKARISSMNRHTTEIEAPRNPLLQYQQSVQMNKNIFKSPHAVLGVHPPITSISNVYTTFPPQLPAQQSIKNVNGQFQQQGQPLGQQNLMNVDVQIQQQLQAQQNLKIAMESWNQNMPSNYKYNQGSCISNTRRTISMLAAQPPFDETKKSQIRKILDDVSGVGIYSMEDVLVNQYNADNSPLARLHHDDVRERYENFKKFDTVVDHSDHLFSAHTSPMNQPPRNWVEKIQLEWRILEKDLPDTIFVRAYESRMELLRAVIIGAKGTPYHDGLFFFDVCFPSTYPYSPPLVRYHSGGLGINPNLSKCGEVQSCLLSTWTGFQKEKTWVPGTSTLIQVLVSIQDQIFNTKPFFNGLEYAYMRQSVVGERLSLLYNENTLIKSLKTMMITMNKPPKNFEDLVVGHFRNRVRDILMACKAYLEGYNEVFSITFKNDVASSLKPLVQAFNKIGALEAQEFLTLIEKKTPIPTPA